MDYSIFLSPCSFMIEYARDIPFELIINTKMPEQANNVQENPAAKSPGTCIPTMVSMIPGAVVHFIKKISSSCNTAMDILANFYIEGLSHRKIFIIDEITAPFSAAMSAALGDAAATSGTLANILIDVAPKSYTKYFTYKDTVYISRGYEEEGDDNDYKILPVKATGQERATYHNLLTKNTRQDVSKRAEAIKPDTLPKPEAIAAIRAAQEKK